MPKTCRIRRCEGVGLVDEMSGGLSREDAGEARRVENPRGGEAEEETWCYQLLSGSRLQSASSG